MPKTIFILLIIFLFSPLKAQPNLSSTSKDLHDTCFSGHKIMPECVPYAWVKYQIGDSIYSRDQVVNLLSKSPSTQGIMMSSKSCAIIGSILACAGLLGGTIGSRANNPVLAFTSIGISISGIGLFLSSVGLTTKAIKVYNKSLCNDN
jgi:hypothetical protein